MNKLGHYCIGSTGLQDAIRARCQDLGVSFPTLCRDNHVPYEQELSTQQYDKCVRALNKKGLMVADVSTLSMAEAETQAEVRYINTILGIHKGNVSAAARQMGIDRGTLKRKMNAHGIKSERVAYGQTSKP